MAKRSRRIFLDTSVVFSAVYSPGGGARKLFQLGEIGALQLIVGPTVLQECEEVVRRKAPISLPTLALLLELGGVEIIPEAPDEILEQAKTIVRYEPDAFVLAEAMVAKVSWLVTHDKQQFFSIRENSALNFKIGTPGDFLQNLADELK
jgi:predicted nucleic acid-binding protein